MTTWHCKKIHVTVYRKPIHTDRYLGYNSHHDKQYKLSTAKTLIHCAFSLPTTQDDREKEIQHITNMLLVDGYLKKVISTVIKSKEPNPIPQPEQLVKEFFDMVEPPISDHHFATLPYVTCNTEPLTRILQCYNIIVSNDSHLPNSESLWNKPPT